MGFVDKLKNLFTEEEEEIEEIPVKKEVIHVDIPAPVKPKREDKEEVTLKKEEPEEEKFKFPVYFDDKDFDELKPAPRPEPKHEIRETRESRSSEPYGGKKPYQGNIGKKSTVSSVAKKKKGFAPSPIISPVYGVLDKNYHKEDITNKQEVKSTPIISHTNSKITIDDVRNKAYGTLEDDLETTLFGKNSILFNEKEEKKETEDFFDDLGFGLDEDVEPEETTEEKVLTREDITLGDMDQIADESEEEHEELKEDDLFDLIDSMYEKREDNE